MRRLLKWLLIAAVIAGVVTLVSKGSSKRHEFAAMSDDEIRALIDSKLADQVSSEKLTQIQDAAVKGAAKLRGASAVVAENAAEVADEAAEAAGEAAAVAEEAASVAGAAAEVAEEAAEEDN
jgi:hypothetical protein